MIHSKISQQAAYEFWQEVRGLLRESNVSATDAERSVSHYRELLQSHEVDEELIYHRGVETAATAAMKSMAKHYD